MRRLDNEKLPILMLLLKKEEVNKILKEGKLEQGNS